MSAAETRARAVLSRFGDSPLAGAEVGVHDGRMSEQLLRLHPRLTLYMIDNWKPAEAQAPSYQATGDPRAQLNERQARHAMTTAIERTAFASTRAHVRQGDSVETAVELPDGWLDFAFLDADHSYEGVRADIEAWTPKVKPGGWLCGHDYGARAFPGVQRAVDEACEREGWTLEWGDNFTWFVRL